MKQLFIITFSFLTLSSVYSQTQRADSLNQRLFDVKVEEMTLRLNLTDEQKTTFAPIYHRYNDEMIAAWEGYKRPTHPSTSQEAAVNIRKNMEMQQRSLTIRLKYIDEFAAVLTPQQMSRLFNVENMIQRRIKAKKAQAFTHENHANPHSHSAINKRFDSKALPTTGKLPAIKHNHNKKFKGVTIPPAPDFHRLGPDSNVR